jgi:hypothetical protein
MVDEVGQRRQAHSARRLQRSRRIALVYGAGAVILIGWAAYLGVSLPVVHLARHWNVAWVGLDVLIVGALTWTAWRASHRDRRVVVPAVATATLLIVDAWMDVSTASRSDLALSIVLAVCVELPLAALSLLLARRAIRAEQPESPTSSGRDLPRVRRRANSS